MKSRLLAVILVLSAGNVSAWTPQTALQLASDASQLMPESLQIMIKRNWNDLLSGLSGATALKCTVSELPALVDKHAQRGSSLINKRQPFNDVIYQFGYIAQLITRGNDAFSVTSFPADEQNFAARNDRFVEESLAKFQLTFRGFSRYLNEFEDISHLIKTSVERTQEYSTQMTQAYREKQQEDPNLTFDEQSVPFGISSLTYNNAMADIADVWLLIWRKSGGDTSKMICPFGTAK